MASIEKPTSTETVTVACKLPHGLRIRLFEFVNDTEAVLGGGVRDIKRPQQIGDEIILKGTAARAGERPKADMAGGYALTYGVSKDFFEEWLRQNADADYVKRGLVFCDVKKDMVVGKAKEQREIRSNLEPLRPGATGKDQDYRIPSGRFKIEKAVLDDD